ncbi:hypothetical protein BJ165DRAFT_1612782 [Panaeolus papilionaceus]|nr:hypothetical protein BJ165DRAFT_1612782 [Panaeolus papilionaceus]
MGLPRLSVCWDIRLGPRSLSSYHFQLRPLIQYFHPSATIVSAMDTTLATTPSTSDSTTPYSSDRGGPTLTTSSGEKIPAGAFIAGLVGGIAAFVLLFGLIACVLIKRKKRNNVNNDDNASSSSSNPSTTSLDAEEPRVDLDMIKPSMIQAPAQDTRMTQLSSYVPQVNAAQIPQQHENDHYQSPETYTITQGPQLESNKNRPFTSTSLLSQAGTKFGPRASRSFPKQGLPSTPLPHSSIGFLARATTRFGPRARSSQQPEPSSTMLPHISTDIPADDSHISDCRPVSHSLQPLRPQTLARPFQPLRASHDIAEL